jgi:hypothetical protein
MAPASDTVQRRPTVDHAIVLRAYALRLQLDAGLDLCEPSGQHAGAAS